YIGDAILWRYIPNRYGEPALPPSYLYPTEYLDTIRLFMSMKPDHIYTAHYRPMEGDDANRFLQESLEFAQELEATILQIHREFREPLTLKQVIQEVFNIYKIWPEEAKWDLAYPISGHLNSLVSRGLIKAVRRNGLPAWVAV
ncbi:MAG: hypothetical protein QXI97_09260, partial [Nitrososphaerota archaeon]